MVATYCQNPLWYVCVIEIAPLAAMTRGLALVAELPGAKWHPAQSWLATSSNVLRQICRACRHSSRPSSQGQIPSPSGSRDPQSGPLLHSRAPFYGTQKLHKLAPTGLFRTRHRGCNLNISQQAFGFLSAFSLLQRRLSKYPSRYLWWDLSARKIARRGL
jgi:hypothetical protein